MAMMADLPDDLLIEILAVLPVKSILRFRSVSKSWKYLISSPNFVSSHLAYAADHDNKVLVRRCPYNQHASADRTVSYKLCSDNATLDKIVDVDFPFASQNDFFTMIGCVDGLVCLSDDLQTHTDTLYLWNPVLRRSLALPPPSIAASGTVVLGFGSASGDYRVVRILYGSSDWRDLSPSPISAEIYSLTTGEWRQIRVPESLPLIRGRQANVNGSLHWLARINHRNVIVRFNLGTEEFDKLVCLPSKLQPERMENLTIAAWGKSLAVFQVECRGSFCMYVMEASASWTQRFVVESSGMLKRIRSLRRNGEVVFEASENQLVVFDPQSKQIRPCEFEVEASNNLKRTLAEVRALKQHYPLWHASSPLALGTLNSLTRIMK
ncbi:hypothetical protein V2J09_018358 [Rumex salicifolius]